MQHPSANFIAIFARGSHRWQQLAPMLMVRVVGGWNVVGKHKLGCSGHWWTLLSSENVLAVLSIVLIIMQDAALFEGLCAVVRRVQWSLS